MTTVPAEIPEYGGCLWPMDPACKTDVWDTYEPEVQLRALALASSTLQRLTGYRVGGCPITVRPLLSKGICFLPLRLSVPLPGYAPYINSQGTWVNFTGVVHDNPCTVELPPPVGMVEVVKVDGVELDWNDFAIDNGNLLVWLGEGECPWPEDQDITLPDTEVGTFSVTYWNSHPVDSLGAYAVGILALEFAKACGGGAGGSKCRLPANVVTVVRSGVTYELEGGSFPSGFTGIREVDTYIASWNPNGLRQEATVYVPRRHRRRDPRFNTGGSPIAPGRIYDGGHP